MRAKDVMTSPALCCSIDDTVEQVAALMWEYELHAVPVVDAAGRPLGWVTDRSICMAAFRTRRSLASLAVGCAMLPCVPTVRDDTALSLLERQISRAHAPWLLVLDEDGRTLGVVTDGDLARVRVQPAPARSVRRRAGAEPQSPRVGEVEARRWAGL